MTISEQKNKANLNEINSKAPKGSFFYRHHVDIPLLLGLLMTLCFSLFVLYSASGQHFDMLVRQVTRTGAAFILMIIVAQIPPRFFVKASFWLYLLGIVLLVLVELFGDISKGAQRWLNLGFVRIQPSEIFKVVMPLTVAVFLSRSPLPPKPLTTILSFVLVGIPTVLVLLQPDLGTATLIAVSGMIAIFIAGLSWWWIILGTVVAGAALPVMWNFVLHDYQKQRVFTLLDPSSDPLGAGYHIIQSKIAIGSGEETGLIGFLILMLIYCFILGRCIYITLNALNPFSRILCGAFTFTFMFYIFVNIGMVSGILPVVGVPLPLISYGGTAMITLTVCFGMIMSIHTHKKQTYFRQN